jgi:hypothetical protein
MIKLHADDALGIKTGMKCSLLIPGDGELFAPREIHAVMVDDKIIGFVLITRVQIGSIKHWTHEPDTKSAYGCATPHELVDRLKQYHEDHKFESEQDSWTKLTFMVIDNWSSEEPEKMAKAIFALKFKAGIGSKL